MRCVQQWTLDNILTDRNNADTHFREAIVTATNPVFTKSKKSKKLTWWVKNRINALRVAAVLLVPFLVMLQPGVSPASLSFALMDMAGILLVFAGVLGRFWCIVYIGGRKSEVVFQDGPYSICRHPLYLFSTIATLGLGLMLGSIVLSVLFAGIVYFILSRTAKGEEKYLRAEFGTDYDDYAARVPRILPNAALWQTQPYVTADLKHLRGNFKDALVFIMLIPATRIIVWLRETYDLGFIPIF
ncbi:isoprenylcysteine carboxylmethyltransferase family protein [Roseinatronobacter bogoriensis subsp. barguzinensis]|uniref:Isoprenylcysteine carboxylmethyltransferase family protein n=2 Tax=Roseinatronobacter bogoriensis TaxID=119542 RepID=A0A2K8KMT0_9RHOB|nr:isoprenylcysteine carboxylmethyltransferase family protein [Rhodobaca barguzinensis]